MTYSVPKDIIFTRYYLQDDTSSDGNGDDGNDGGDGTGGGSSGGGSNGGGSGGQLVEEPEVRRSSVVTTPPVSEQDAVRLYYSQD